MWIWILCAIVVLLLAALLGTAWYFFQFSMVRRSPERDETEYFTSADSVWRDIKDEMLETQQWIRQNGELVSIRSHDGLKLSAWQVPAEGDHPRGTLIVFHGYRSLATVDFTPEVKFLHRQGYRLLIPYQRSHGESEGKYITYGVNERYDCQRWAQYVAEEFGGTIFLAGISMGSATVMMSSDLPMPENVRGIIADCGFTTPWEIMKTVAWHDYKLPAFPILHLVNCLAKCLAKVDLKGADARVSLAHTQLPVLFLHGDVDDFVPLHMTTENYAACRSEKTLYVVKGAEHAQCFAHDPAGCEQKIAEFLQKYGTEKD